MTGPDDLQAVRALRPDQVPSDEPNDPTGFARRKRRLLDESDDAGDIFDQIPDVTPRLAYRDVYAAIDYLTRVFGFTEIREARMEFDDHCLAWFRVGSGAVMIGPPNVDVHRIHSPADVGHATAMLNVYVEDVDAHYAHSVSEGADVTMQLDDAFYGERRYEVTDLDGHRWHIAERFESIVERHGRPPEPSDC